MCEFRDGLAPLVYITADGQLKDFCRDHYWGAIQQEVDVVRAGVRQQTFAELKAKRLEELSK